MSTFTYSSFSELCRSLVQRRKSFGYPLETEREYFELGVLTAIHDKVVECIGRQMLDEEQVKSGNTQQQF